VGLLNYQARFYVPGIGRFASADTLVPDHKNPQQYNRYTYALNNTLKYVDPTGHYVILPSCWLCKVEIDISQWSSLSVNVASGVCLVAGCHVNREEGTLTGPTQQEAIENSLLNMAGPLGKVSLTATQAGRNIVGKTLGEAFERAADFGIQTFRKLGQELGVGSGLQRHHIIEKRFAENLGIANTDDMLSIALTREEHQRFTNAWRNWIGYNGDTSKRLTTQNATQEDIWRAAQDIYRDYPELLEAARKTLFGE
jgi:hypothetical protein